MTASTLASSHYLTDSQILAVQHVIVRIGCEFLFFGIHALLFFVSICVLFNKGIRGYRSRMFLFTVITIMFLSSFGVVVLDMIMCLRQASSYGLNAPSTKELNLQLRLSTNALMRLNFLLGDIIVVWRTWVVWSRNVAARVILAICMLGTIGAVVGNGVKAALDLVRNTPGPESLSLVLTLPPLITNLAATILIALKVWQYRVDIRSKISNARSTTRAEHVLILLVESGFLYCGIWLLILIAGFDVMSSVANIIILGIAVSLTGIYPTFIVIMVAFEKSHANTIFSQSSGTVAISQSIHFAEGRHTTTSSDLADHTQFITAPEDDKKMDGSPKRRFSGPKAWKESL